MFNALVTTMTLIALGFVVAWWLRPDIRDLMEATKYHINLFDGVGSADGIGVGRRFRSPHECGCCPISLSTIVVAANAQLLRRLKLQRAGSRWSVGWRLCTMAPQKLSFEG